MLVVLRVEPVLPGLIHQDVTGSTVSDDLAARWTRRRSSDRSDRSRRADAGTGGVEQHFGAGGSIRTPSQWERTGLRGNGLVSKRWRPEPAALSRAKPSTRGTQPGCRRP